MRARQLGGQIKYLSQGEIEARNRGYGPYSVETRRTREYWANKAGCGHLLTRPDGMRTRQKADPQNGRFPLGATPYSPKPMPGDTATLACSSRSLENARLPVLRLPPAAE